MTNLNAYAVALAPLNFNLKTKALAAFIKGNTKTFDLLKVNLTSFGEPDASADVWALMLLNYHLNGSSPNFNNMLMHRADRLTNESITADKRQAAFDYFKSTVAPRTYNRWANALATIKTVAEREKHAPQDDVKDLTLAQIEKLLGYKVRIVA
jgi:hypothetical protein